MTTRMTSADYAETLDTMLTRRLSPRPPAAQRLRFAAQLETSLRRRAHTLATQPDEPVREDPAREDRELETAVSGAPTEAPQ